MSQNQNLEMVDDVYAKTQRIIAIAFSLQAMTEKKRLTDYEFNMVDTLLNIIIEQSRLIESIILAKSCK